ncbi:MAG: response regulator transcription factor [Bacteroidetes bacterium]|nr:response regulator transcription factor [Bacteroidota bacterium]
MINISIIEDTEIISKNLVAYINAQQNMQIVLAANSVDDFFAQAKKENFSSHILLLDIGLPGISGLDALPTIKTAFPDMDVIMLTIFDEEQIILKSLCSGACSYISKKSPINEITDAIKIVYDGGSYMSPSIAREIVKHLVNTRSTITDNLTERQTEILKKLTERKSYQVIANELFVSVETVRSHVKKLYKVLHVHNKTEAIAKYLAR